MEMLFLQSIGLILQKIEFVFKNFLEKKKAPFLLKNHKKLNISEKEKETMPLDWIL
jgi:hypothetical protein